MDHVSRPLLIALAATVALVAVWLVALRPKPVAIENTPLAPTKVIPRAKQATAISDAANAKVQAATGSPATGATTQAATGSPAASGAAPTTSSSSPTAAKSGSTPHAASPPKTSAPPATAKRSVGERRDAAVQRDLKRGKVVVVLFWNPAASDDIATRGAVREIDLHHGKVAVHVVLIKDVAQYTSVTRGVKIAQSPTTVIIGRKGDTRTIVGLTEPRELSQAVEDALAGH